MLNLKLLSKLAFENLGHPFQPFIVGQRSIGPKFALMTGAKLVFMVRMLQSMVTE